MNNFFFDIIDYFSSPDFQRTLLWIKLFSAGISSLLIFALIVLLSRSRATWWISEGVDSFRKVSLPQRQEQRWVKIKERLEKADEANIKLAVIEADNLFDDILKRMAFPGKDMGERLKQFEKHELKSIDLVWEAHKLRNLVVHQPNIKITQEEAKKAVENYEGALKELEVL